MFRSLGLSSRRHVGQRHVYNPFQRYRSSAAARAKLSRTQKKFKVIVKGRGASSTAMFCWYPHHSGEQELLMDLCEDFGGSAIGPDPYEVFLASLGQYKFSYLIVLFSF